MTRGSAGGGGQSDDKAPPPTSHRYYVPKPGTRGDGAPPGVMWPEPESGYEPSGYSPGGRLEQEATIASNVGRDPAVVWRALRGSWGLWIILGGVALVVVVALVSAALS
jgi:hypothetical protein